MLGRRSASLLVMLLLAATAPVAGASSALAQDDCFLGRDASSDDLSGDLLPLPIRCAGTFASAEGDREDNYAFELREGDRFLLFLSAQTENPIEVYLHNGMNSIEDFVAGDLPTVIDIEIGGPGDAYPEGTWMLSLYVFGDSEPLEYHLAASVDRTTTVGTILAGTLGFRANPLWNSPLVNTQPDSTTPVVDGEWIPLSPVGTGNETIWMASSSPSTVSGLRIDFYDADLQHVGTCLERDYCGVPVGAEWVLVWDSLGVVKHFTLFHYH